MVQIWLHFSIIYNKTNQSIFEQLRKRCDRLPLTLVALYYNQHARMFKR